MKRAPWCIKDTRTHHILCLRHMSSAELHVAMAALLRAVALHHRAKKKGASKSDMEISGSCESIKSILCRK